MNPITQSKQELEASIRYCENAIASAKQTIESMATYQEQTGREQALQNQVGELKSECAALEERIDEMKADAFAKSNTIKDLKLQLAEREDKWDDAMNENRELHMKIEELKTNMALMTDELEKPTMPVIPKNVAIAIFREGVQSGINDAVAELEGQSITIEESEYCGDFEVSFSRRIDLDDELDLDWMRGKVGQYEEGFVTDALKGLCVSKEFECRIHGIDDTTIDLTKKND